MKTLDEKAAVYINRLVKEDENYNRGDMETCYVVGAQEASVLQPEDTGTFGQALGSLQVGMLVRRQGWNGKGMFLFMRPFDSLKDDFIIDTVKSLPYNFKEWVKHHKNESKDRFFQQYLCLKAADGTIINGWLPSMSDLFAQDWELVNPEE